MDREKYTCKGCGHGLIAHGGHSCQCYFWECECSKFESLNSRVGTKGCDQHDQDNVLSLIARDDNFCRRADVCGPRER